MAKTIRTFRTRTVFKLITARSVLDNDKISKITLIQDDPELGLINRLQKMGEVVGLTISVEVGGNYLVTYPPNAIDFIKD